MFEALETGKKISSDEFTRREKTLRQRLLTAQFDLAKRNYPMIILIAGLDGAGNDKPYARIQILKTFCKSIERALDD